MAKKTTIVEQDTLITELNELDTIASEASDNSFDEFDDIELDTLPDEGNYALKFTAIKPMPNKQLEVTVSSSDESIKFTFIWFSNSLSQNLTRLKTLHRGEEFAQGTTGQLIQGLIGKEVKIQVKYNGAFVNYNVI